MTLPVFVTRAISRLEAAGYEAYVVGGAVRDHLMGRRPADFDLCTNATPAEVTALFHDCRPVTVGARYGTVKIMGNLSIEITTFRSDSVYSDSRHPEMVRFGHSIKEDLARRDFTINAIACHPEKGYIDPFGGQADIQAKLIRCVGDPARRFSEDALRILRAIRFAARFGFAIEPLTWQAALDHRALLSRLSAERLRDELSAFIICPRAGDLLIRFREILFEIIPELKPCNGFQQHSPHHHHDVLGHIAETINHCPPALPIRLAALLHDIGKPLCFTRDERGQGHFPGHMDLSAGIARDFMSRLRYPSRMIETVCLLIANHDRRYQATPAGAREWLGRLGPKQIFVFIKLKRADCLAHAPSYYFHLRKLAQFRREVCAALRRGDCYSLRQLAVGGRDLIRALGFAPGPLIGETLDALLNAVVQGEVVNARAQLLQLAAQIQDAR